MKKYVYFSYCVSLYSCMEYNTDTIYSHSLLKSHTLNEISIFEYRTRLKINCPDIHFHEQTVRIQLQVQYCFSFYLHKINNQ